MGTPKPVTAKTGRRRLVGQSLAVTWPVTAKGARRQQIVLLVKDIRKVVPNENV